MRSILRRWGNVASAIKAWTTGAVSKRVGWLNFLPEEIHSMPNAIRLVVLSFLVLLSSAAWSQCCADRRTISVNASATVTADADLAIVRVGYRLYGPDGRTAYASASETSNAIMHSLAGSGVSKRATERTSTGLQQR